MDLREIIHIAIGVGAILLSICGPFIIANRRQRRWERFERQPHEPLGMRGTDPGQSAHIVVDVPSGEGTRP